MKNFFKKGTPQNIYKAYKSRFENVKKKSKKKFI